MEAYQSDSESATFGLHLVRSSLPQITKWQTLIPFPISRTIWYLNLNSYRLVTLKYSIWGTEFFWELKWILTSDPMNWKIIVYEVCSSSILLAIRSISSSDKDWIYSLVTSCSDWRMHSPMIGFVLTRDIFWLKAFQKLSAFVVVGREGELACCVVLDVDFLLLVGALTTGELATELRLMRVFASRTRGYCCSARCTSAREGSSPTTPILPWWWGKSQCCERSSIYSLNYSSSLAISKELKEDIPFRSMWTGNEILWLCNKRDYSLVGGGCAALSPFAYPHIRTPSFKQNSLILVQEHKFKPRRNFLPREMRASFPASIMRRYLIIVIIF